MSVKWKEFVYHKILFPESFADFPDIAKLGKLLDDIFKSRLAWASYAEPFFIRASERPLDVLYTSSDLSIDDT